MADRRSDRESDDPGVIRSIAVTVDDVVTALEANASADRGAVLRVTPPFSGRMRARIHVDDGGGYEGDAEPIHLDPTTLVEEVPAYPTADETSAYPTADETSAGNADSDDIETRRQRHTERLAEWRSTVRERLRERISVDHPDGTLDVQLHALG